MDKKIVIAIIAVIAVVVVVALLMPKGEGAKSLNIDDAAAKLNASAPFNEMAAMDITSDLLEGIYGINPANVEKVAGKAPMMNVHSSMYMLLQAKEGTVDTVKAELDKYLTQYEQQWSTYLPAQYELVKNRKAAVVGNTIYVIIAENAEALATEITK